MGAEYRHLLAHASEKVKRADFTLMADAIASPAFTRSNCLLQFIQSKMLGVGENLHGYTW